MKLFRVFIVFGFIYFCVFASQARAGSTLMCEVKQFETSAASLPIGGNLTPLPQGSPVKVGSNYMYTVDLHSSPGVTDHIRSIYVHWSGTSREPIDIVGVRFIGGPCSIDSDKRISCLNLHYQYTDGAPMLMEVLVRPTYSTTGPLTNVLFGIYTDLGSAVCGATNSIQTASLPTATPSRFLPAVSNLRVKGYRSLTGYESNYKEAVLTWNSLSGAQYYDLYRMNANVPYSFGGTKDSTYAVRFLPDTQWDVAIKAADNQWVEGDRSEIVHIAYPGFDTLPAVPSSNSTPSPSATPPELTVPKNVRVVGFEPIANSSQLNAVISWSPVPGAESYQMYVQTEIGATPITQVGITSTQSRVAGYPGNTLHVSIGIEDTRRNIRLASEYFPITYPNAATGTPIATPRPAPTLTPRPFDSTKVALLEEKVAGLEQKLQAQEQTNAMQTERIEKQETLLTKIRNFLSRWFRI